MTEFALLSGNDVRSGHTRHFRDERKAPKKGLDDEVAGDGIRYARQKPLCNQQCEWFQCAEPGLPLTVLTTEWWPELCFGPWQVIAEFSLDPTLGWQFFLDASRHGLSRPDNGK